MVNAEFKKAGKTELIVESPNGETYNFDLKIERSSYEIKRK